MSEPNTSSRPGRRSVRAGRSVLAGVAVVLAVVLFLTSVTAVWAKRTVLSADRLVAAVDRAADDPAVTDALAATVTDQIASLVDVGSLVDSLLPDQLDQLGGVLEAAVERVIRDQVAEVVGSPQGRALLETAVRVAHDAAVKVLRGKGFGLDAFFVSVDGAVRLDAVPLVVRSVEVLQERGVIPDTFDLTEVVKETVSDRRVQLLAKVFGVSLPDDFGQITVLDADQVEKGSAVLSSVQRAFAIFEKASAVLIVLSLLLLAAALVLSTDRRRTLVQFAAGVALLAVVMRIAIDRVVAAVDAAVDSAGAKAAAVNITDSLTSSLARSLVTLAILGGSIAVIAWLLRPSGDGSPSWLTRLVASRPEVARLAVLVLAVAVLATVGIGWVSLLLVGALAVAAVLFVGRLPA